MPNSDGKGPAGAGPKTGKGRGPCSDGISKTQDKDQGHGPGKGTGKGTGNGHGKVNIGKPIIQEKRK